jgi:hypothetical protein
LSGGGRGGPRLPTWLLVAFVAGCIGGAAWLFLAGGIDGGDGGDRAKESAAEVDPDRPEGVLVVPDDDEPTDERRRGEQGRERIDPEDAVAPAEGPREDDDARLPELPAVLGALRGRSVALLAASAPGDGDIDRTVSIAGVDAPCAALADAARAQVERELLDRVAGLLDRAGAGVVRADAPDACVDARVRRAQQADLVLALRAGTADDEVVAGRPAAARTGASDASRTGGAAQRSLESATTVGARRPPTALLDLDLRGATADELDELALELATALAVTSSRADVDS